MIDCTCGYAENIPEDQKTCPNCGIDLTPLHRLRSIPRMYSEEGIRLAKQGDLQRALETLVAAISLDGGSIAAYIAVGDVYARKGLYAEAIGSFEKVLRIDPGNADAREAKLKAEQLRKKSKAAVPRRLVYVLVAIALVVGFTAPPAFKRFTRQRPPSLIVANVQQELARYPALARLNLAVGRSGRRQLTISGEVPTELHRDLVAEVARRLTNAQLTVATNILVRPPAPPRQAPSGFRYMVRPGDTLSGLSRRFYGESQQWPKIVAANEARIRNPGNLAVGEILVIPFK